MPTEGTDGESAWLTEVERFLRAGEANTPQPSDVSPPGAGPEEPGPSTRPFSGSFAGIKMRVTFSALKTLVDIVHAEKVLEASPRVLEVTGLVVDEDTQAVTFTVLAHGPAPLADFLASAFPGTAIQVGPADQDG